VNDVQFTLMLSIALVVLVIFLVPAQRSRATLIPAVAIPLALLGTFVAMYFWATRSTTSRCSRSPSRWASSSTTRS
jgi:multidrug efflux pump subunit AcrB